MTVHRTVSDHAALSLRRIAMDRMRVAGDVGGRSNDG
jgi:hypothetical protein